MGSDTPVIPGLDFGENDDRLITGLQPDRSDRNEKEPESSEEFVRLLFKRLATAKKLKEKWEQDFEVDRSHDYVKGFQRPEGDEKDSQNEKKYQINKILSSLKAKIPNIFYYHPYVRVRASRSREDTPAQTVTQRARLLQDTINTIIRMPETRYKAECMYALKEAQWAFGVVEVGYDAEWGENPYAARPPLVENEEIRDDLEDEGRVLPEDGIATDIAALLEVPHKETFYTKYIPARQFFVSSNDRSATESLDWVAYWEWMYIEDIKRTESYDGTEDIKASGKMGDLGYDSDLTPLASSSDDNHPDMARVWKFFDLREKKRYVIAEGHETLLKETAFDHLPLIILRMEVMPGEWYPIPPVFSGLTEQDEFNDSREYLRVIRKGTRPRYIYDKNAFDPEELAKLESDDFFTFIAVNNSNMDAIKPIQQPSMSDTAIRTIALSEEGFSEQAGVSPTARLTRSAGGAPTATEVTALELRGNVRDSYEQQEVADWLAAVANGLLFVAIEKMTLPKWVAMNSDPYSPYFITDAVDISERYREITSEELGDAAGGISWDVTVDVESMSPTSESQHAQKLMQVLNLLSQQGVGRLLSLSPQLLKLMLNLVGIRSDSDQKAIMEALTKRDQLEQEMIAAKSGPMPGQKGVAPMPGQKSPNAPPTPGPPKLPPLPPSVQSAIANAPGGPQPQQPPNPPGRPS